MQFILSASEIPEFFAACAKISATSAQSPQLDRIEAGLQILLKNQGTTMATLADIQAKVAAETTVEGSVLALLSSVSADLKTALASNDPVALQAVADQLDKNTAALSAAVLANTPAAPAPVPAPVSPTPVPASAPVATDPLTGQPATPTA